MALFIRDAEVEALADEVRKITKAKTKTEAVRRALKAHLAEARRLTPLRERMARSKALADAIGPSDRAFDMKAYSDEMWGET
jgi:antitoxin VapB